MHSISNTGEHGRSSRQDDVSIEIATDIEITLEDGVVPVSEKGHVMPRKWKGREDHGRGFVDTGGFETEEGRLEESFGGTEADGTKVSGRHYGNCKR